MRSTLTRSQFILSFLTAGLAPVIAAPAAARAATGGKTPGGKTAAAARAKFDADRAAILAMAGNFKVKFLFRETVPLAAGYELKPDYVTDGDEIVRVIADDGRFISLQQILVVGEEGKKRVVKHWRQDWTYEPREVLAFVGRNTWERRPVGKDAARGAWSQVVYQVDDSPRYGGLGAWSHDTGVAEWTSEVSWRPLPRRDATTRGDYGTIAGINRHTITPRGWVHEQDNTKLMLGAAPDDPPRALAREIAVNTYDTFEDFPKELAEDYWAKTAAYWAEVRDEWAAIAADNRRFGLTLQGEPEAFYLKTLRLADQVHIGELSTAMAAKQARQIIRDHVHPQSHYASLAR